MLAIEEFADRLDVLAAIGQRSITIGTSDPGVSKIVRALEFGSIAGHRPWPSPGPKTTVAVDPETGARIVVSLRAPQGFIRIRAQNFLDGLHDSLARARNWLDPVALDASFERAVSDAADAALIELQAATTSISSRIANNLTIRVESRR